MENPAKRIARWTGNAVALWILSIATAASGLSEEAVGWRDSSSGQSGHTLFARGWTSSHGLGPEINATSCVACHAEPQTGGAGADPRSIVRLAIGIRDPTGGRVVRRLRVDATGSVTELAIPPDSVGRRTPSLVGLGLLEQVDDDELARYADPGDRDGDGISGRVGSGRFGWKARFGTLAEAVAAAFANELGLSSPGFPDVILPPGTRPGPPEISEREIGQVVSFIRTLIPRPATPSSARDRVAVAEGERLFTKIACASCHRPALRLPDGRSIHPYTDLLLHDMGPALADGISEGRASGSEFRTTPLWNLNPSGPFLHDGRAATMDAAIRAHGGEATAAARAYALLSERERSIVSAFVASR